MSQALDGRVKKIKLRRSAKRLTSFGEHLAIESIGGRHTPIPLQFDAHGLNITSVSLSEPSLEVFSGEGPLTFPPAGRC